MANHTEGEHYAIQYANWWNMQPGPYYGDTNLLDEEECPEAAANAKLYAAAPELLAAGKIALGRLLSSEPGFAELTAAIKKATE